MEIFTIAKVLIAEAIFIAKTLICISLWKNCKVNKDLNIIGQHEKTCSCLKGNENGSEQTSHSIFPDITKESTSKGILIDSKARLVPVKPPRAFRQSRVKHSIENENNVHSKTFSNDISKLHATCICDQHREYLQKENELLKVSTERNSSGFLPISNKLQKQTSFRVVTDSTKNSSKIAEKLRRELYTKSSSEFRCSQCRYILSQNIGTDEDTRYMDLPTLECPTHYLQQNIIRNKTNPLTSTEIGSKSAIKNSSCQKLYKYFARLFRRCINRISKK